MAQETELIAYCGLYCGDCFIGEGAVAEAAKDLSRKLSQTKCDRVAGFVCSFPGFEVFKDYPKFVEVLDTLAGMHCTKTCRQGGGPPECPVRKCCTQKEIMGCWQCDQFADCQTLSFLANVHDDGHLKNLQKLQALGPEKFVQGPRDW